MNKKLNICNRIIKLDVENFEHFHSNIRVNKKITGIVQATAQKQSMVDGWVGGWKGAKSVVRIAYSEISTKGSLFALGKQRISMQIFPSHLQNVVFFRF